MTPRATMVVLALVAGCPAGKERSEPPPAAATAEACLDAQLAAKGLNQFGDPPETMYTGGTPLFDERTGRRRDRKEYVFARHPEIARACGAAD